MTWLKDIQGHTFYGPALDSKSVVLDLGASGGEFSLKLITITGCTCFCADASPDAYQLMTLQDGIEPYHLAITSRDGPLDMDIGGYEGDYYWVKEKTDGTGIKVPGVTLGSFMSRCGIEAADLIKVDIEGAEFDMFQASSDELLSKVGQFSVEFHDFQDPALRPRVKEVIQRLENLEFKTIVMTRKNYADVLFLNHKILGIGMWDLFIMMFFEKYVIGLKRVLARKARVQRD